MPTYLITLSDGTKRTVTANSPQEAQAQLSGGAPSAPSKAVVGGSAEQRGRVNLSLDPLITAMNATIELEKDREFSPGLFGFKSKRKVKNNPFSDEPFAHAGFARATAQLDAGPLKRQAYTAMAGPDFSEEMNAYKQIEAAALPMFSGMQVVQSEAQRWLQANSPQPEDSYNTVKAKQLARKQLVNGAAAQIGKPPPYPEVGSWASGRAPTPPSGSRPPTRSTPTQPAKGGNDVSRMTDAQLRALIARGQ
jgi:hypothetical protein